MTHFLLHLERIGRTHAVIFLLLQEEKMSEHTKDSMLVFQRVLNKSDAAFKTTRGMVDDWSRRKRTWFLKALSRWKGPGATHGGG